MGSPVHPAAEPAIEQQQVNLRAVIQGVNAARRTCAEAQADSTTVLTQHTRQLLEHVSGADDHLTQALVRHGGVEAVVPLLTLADRASLQLEDVSRYACAVLEAVAAKPEHKQLVTQALPGLFKLMQPHSRNTSGARWAADTVSALAQDSRAMQEMLREAGGIVLLVQLLDAGDPRTQRSAVAALRAVCGHTKNEANMRHVLACDALPKLVKLLQSKEVTVHNKALQLLGDLTHSGQPMRQAALQAGALAPLIKLLSSSTNKETQRAAALIVGQFAAPPQGPGQSMEGAVPALVRLLASPEPSVQEMAAFAVARLVQQPVNQAALIAAEGFPPLLGLLNSPVSRIQYSAAFALHEMAAAREHLPVFHKAGGLQHLHICSQRLRRGTTKACVDRVLLRLESHKAAASRAAAADAAAISDRAATAPDAEGITLAPLQLLAPSVDPEGALGSLPALPAAPLFGKAWPGTDDAASGPAAVLAMPAQLLLQRLPTIDEIVAEAAAATAAEVAAEGSAAAQLLLLQQQQQRQQRELSPVSLTDLRRRAVAVELRLQMVQQQQQPVSGPLLRLAVARLCTHAGATAQAQQLAACALAQRQDLLQPDSGAAEAASAAAGMLAAAAAAEAQAVSALLKVLMLHKLREQGIPVSLVRQIRSSNRRWARAVRQLADAAEQHVQPDCQAGSNQARGAASAALLVLMGAAAVGAHKRHGPLEVMALVDAARSLCTPQAVPARNVPLPAAPTGPAACAAAVVLVVLALAVLVLFLRRSRAGRARCTPRQLLCPVRTRRPRVAWQAPAPALLAGRRVSSSSS